MGADPRCVDLLAALKGDHPICVWVTAWFMASRGEEGPCSGIALHLKLLWLTEGLGPPPPGCAWRCTHPSGCLVLSFPGAGGWSPVRTPASARAEPLHQSQSKGVKPSPFFQSYLGAVVSRKPEMVSVQPPSAPACIFFSPLNACSKGRAGQETKGCRAKLIPSVTTEPEVSLQVSVILLAFEEEFESVG